MEEGQNGKLVRCRNCNTPVFEVRDGNIVIIAKHHGECHTSFYELKELVREDSPDGRGDANANV